MVTADARPVWLAFEALAQLTFAAAAAILAEAAGNAVVAAAAALTLALNVIVPVLQFAKQKSDGVVVHYRSGAVNYMAGCLKVQNQVHCHALYQMLLDHDYWVPSYADGLIMPH